MTSESSVVIAGGGFAALEAALALRALAANGARLTLVAPEPVLRYRPAATTELFEGASPRAYNLAPVARQLGAPMHLARVEAVAPSARQVRLTSGVRLSYDALVLAIGTRARASISGARTFRDQRDVPAFRDLLADVERGRVRKLVFAVPSGSSWPLPLYELALLSVGYAERHGADLDVTLVTPERAPLEIFGAAGSRGVSRLLEARGVRFLGDTRPLTVRRDGTLELAARDALKADSVITIPRLSAQRIAGIPSTRRGFVPVDHGGRVQGLQNVYAAGDMTTFPVKQGGLATQQADVVAHTIASGLGFSVKQLDSRMTLQAHLVGGPTPLFLRAELDWQGRPTAASASHMERPGEVTSTKVPGRYLAPYLEQLEVVAA
jgi:sulfide:quinone oxidoreductase